MAAGSTGHRVLVTGASGYIAGHCIRELLENGYAIRGTVRNLANSRKTAHLTALADQLGGDLELAEADLSEDSGWPAAAAGCSYILHVASPFPAGVVKDENEVVRPAVDGTLRVLRAAAACASVKRVVLTSSVAAVSAGQDGEPSKIYTETDWTNPERSDIYQKSKTLAERAAWDFVEDQAGDQGIELAVVNPGLVLGPMLNVDLNTSLEVVGKFMRRDLPGSPRVGFAMVDVRDVALAHRLAMETPIAAGHRYICAGEHIWLQDVARILAAEFNPHGYRIPTRALPDWLVRLVAPFDKTVRLIVPYLGRVERVSARKAIDELGWSMRSLQETLIDTGNSMIDQGLVRDRRTAGGATKSG